MPLPPCLQGKAPRDGAEVTEALRTTGYFLEHWVCPSFDINTIPEPRTRLIRLLDNLEMVEEEVQTGPEYNAEEIAWLAQFGSAPGQTPKE